ncbi:hypothetical protein KAU92_04835 [Candidatus Bathyarchaeota archaeon]|nr:hypothetical protein [Candidatus Bathyarchaeota archaeon]
MTEKERAKMEWIVCGIYKNDFERIDQQYEGLDYVLTAFVLDYDSHHWKAVYVETEQLGEPLKATYLLRGRVRYAEKPRGRGVLPVSVSLSVCRGESCS